MLSLNDLALHPISQRLVANYVAMPLQGILLHGEEGVGLGTIARCMGHVVNADPDGTYTVTPIDKKDITIEQIRELYQLTRSKRDSPFIVIIDEANTMSLAAQNALLKLLEEPPHNVHFILTAHSLHAIIPTIISRLGALEIRRLSRVDSEIFIKQRGITDQQKITQLLFIATGRPAELSRLTEGDAQFDNKAETIRQARAILEGSSYERLQKLSSYANDRVAALALLQVLAMLIAYNLRKGAMTNHLDVIEQAINAMHTNANVRLQLLRVAVSLS